MAATERDERLAAALARFEEAHREDPRSVVVDGETLPWSVHYHRRLAHWVERFDPDASVALRLAAACQHVRRWRIPRSDYEAGRRGYRRWRSELADLHARVAREILTGVGYEEAVVSRVEQLVRKQGLARDPEVQRFEDAICMVFLENEYVELAAKHDDAKLVEILRRTWAKMSPAGRAAALELAEGLPERERRLVREASEEGRAPR
ncbi:MAG TPA: DUF4202 domain-containing protein [Longimicrobiales bacterium]|nr:DUF4202 domain-containing protein [Longimicrobiales bacterium]